MEHDKEKRAEAIETDACIVEEAGREEADREEAVERVFQLCQQLSAYQLFRLSCAVEGMMADPQRVREVKNQLRVGDQIEYFDIVKNCCVPAVVQKISRAKVHVQNMDDGQRWRIPIASIDTGGMNIVRPNSARGKLTRNDLAVGDVVSFLDREHDDRTGVIIRLNQKTATIDCEFGTKWRVGYSLLSRVVDANSRNSGPRQLSLLPADDTNDGNP